MIKLIICGAFRPLLELSTRAGEIKVKKLESIQVKDFEKYIGYWKTNKTIYNANEGFEEEYSQLTRVEKKEIVSYEWVEIGG